MKLKHYRAVADVLRRFYRRNPVLVVEIGASLATYFERDNPESFNRTRFYEACGFIPAEAPKRAS